jgi:hypothetical protein
MPLRHDKLECRRDISRPQRVYGQQFKRYPMGIIVDCATTAILSEEQIGRIGHV